MIKNSSRLRLPALNVSNLATNRSKSTERSHFCLETDRKLSTLMQTCDSREHKKYFDCRMEKINQINKYQSNFSSALNLYFEQMNKLEYEEINYTEDQIYKKIKLRKI